MFVRQSTYDRVRQERDEAETIALVWKIKYSNLLDEWNTLVKAINAKGGKEFLDGDTKQTQFTDEDFKRLLQLCHPDKHAGKQMAVDMTAKLLELRG